MSKPTFLVRAILSFFLATWAAPPTARASLFLMPELTAPFDQTTINTLSDVETYRIGSEWGKKPVTAVSMQNANGAFQRAAYATASIASGGTGFYLGKFNGMHVLATNHHVCEIGAQCLNTFAKFTALNRQYKLIKFLSTFKNIDLTLLQMDVPAADEAGLSRIAQNFAFKKDLGLAEPLLTIGYGIGGNPNRNMMANQDSDCLSFSKPGEYRYLKDPDDLNPGPDEVWSFANGCDVSHGDSGSAMVDRSTSEVMGIIWTGKIPKNKRIQNSVYVQNLLKQPNEDIWTELSYAVPAAKMAPYIYEGATKTPWLDTITREVLLKIIDVR